MNLLDTIKAIFEFLFKSKPVPPEEEQEPSEPISLEELNTPDLNQEGMDLIKHFESCKLTSYRDVVGRWTIGWGYAGTEVTSGLIWTQKQADDQLNTSLIEFSKQVDNITCPTFKLTDNQFSALVSFCYNCGVGNLAKLVEGSATVESIGDRITLYNKGRVGGELVTIVGLTRRRLAEQTLFRRPL